MTKLSSNSRSSRSRPERAFAAVARSLQGALLLLPASALAQAQPPTAGETQAEAPLTEAPAAAVAPPSSLEVTIAGVRASRTPGSAHIVNQRQLERFRYDDPNAVLMQVPGVYLRQEDGIGLRPNIGIRGANPDRSKKVTLLEDGVLLAPAPYSAPAAYYFPLMPLMTNVRVIKGPASVAHGPQTVGGAIDLITRPIPSHTAGLLEAALGEYGYNKQHAHFGSSSEQVGFLVEGVRLQNTGFKQLPDDADSGSTRSEVITKFSYVLNPHSERRQELGLKLGYAEEVSNETYLGLSDRDFRRTPLRRYAASALDRMESHRTSLVLSHQLEDPALGLTVKSAAYRHDFARSWRKLNAFRGASIAGVLADVDDPVNASLYAVLTGAEDSGSGSDVLLIGPNQRTFVSQGVQSVLGLKARSGPLEHRVQAGVRAHHDSVRRRHTEDAFAMSDGRLVPEGSATQVTAANRSASYALALHALDAVSWQRLTVTPGVRLELIHSTTEDALTAEAERGFVAALLPGVGLHYAATDVFGVLAGVHRGFSPPPPASDEHVKPESSTNYELGGRVSASRLRAEWIGFYNHYTNLTDLCTLSSGCLSEDLDRQFDAGKARIYGFEAHVAHELPLHDALTLPFFASYTHTQAQFQSSFSSQDPIYGEVRKGDEIPYVPLHQAALGLGLEAPLAGGVVSFNYVAPMREEAGSEPLERALTTDRQVWLDAGAKVRPWPALQIYADLRNVLSSHHIVARRPYGARPNAPRWLQVGAKLQF